MKLAIFGATGFVGKHLVKAALDKGHEVTVLARSPEKLGDLQSRVKVVTGDYFDAAKLAETVKGADAVLSTVGPLPGRNNGQTAGNFAQAMRDLLAAMKAEGIERIVNISGAATVADGEGKALVQRVMRLMMSVMAPVILAGKKAELDVLMASDAAFTTIRPPMISETAKGSLQVDATKVQGMKVDVAQLAGFMVDTLDRPDWVRKVPFVGTR